MQQIRQTSGVNLKVGVQCNQPISYTIILSSFLQEFGNLLLKPGDQRAQIYCIEQWLHYIDNIFCDYKMVIGILTSSAFSKHAEIEFRYITKFTKIQNKVTAEPQNRAAYIEPKLPQSA